MAVTARGQESRHASGEGSVSTYNEGYLDGLKAAHGMVQDIEEEWRTKSKRSWWGTVHHEWYKYSFQAAHVVRRKIEKKIKEKVSTS